MWQQIKCLSKTEDITISLDVTDTLDQWFNNIDPIDCFNNNT
jgi:hypothetical protein